jgi:dihydroorotate dehydrogenase
MCKLGIQGLLLPFVLQVALVALATNPSFHEALLSTVKSWPHVMYSALPVISAIEPQLNTSSMTDALKEVRQTKMHTFTYF